MHIRFGIALIVAAAVLGIISRAVVAQTKGDPVRGFAIAAQQCSECHALLRDRPSPNPRAPAFSAIAAIPGMSDTALHVALQTSHREMPNVTLDAGERADIVAYIIAFKN